LSRPVEGWLWNVVRIGAESVNAFDRGLGL
jgi:hypothetical protein